MSTRSEVASVGMGSLPSVENDPISHESSHAADPLMLWTRATACADRGRGGRPRQPFRFL